MQVFHLQQPQQPGQVRLPGRGAQQVIPANHLVYPRDRIVHHDGQVIGILAAVQLRGVPAAPQHHVVHLAGKGPFFQDVAAQRLPGREAFGDRVGGDQAGRGSVEGRKVTDAQPQRWTTARLGELRPARGSFLLAEIPAGPGVRAWGGVRGAGGLLDLLARAVALVDPPLVSELLQGLCVVVEAVALVDDRPVVGDSECSEVRELPAGGFFRGALGVDVVNAQVEVPASVSGEEPREDRGAQVAQMQVAGGARRITPSALMDLISVPLC